ncbi:MAG: hypothetical protein ACKVU1_00945 [bacterium]
MRLTRTFVFVAIAGLLSQFSMPLAWLEHAEASAHTLTPSQDDHSHGHGHDHPAATPEHDHGVFGEPSGASATIIRVAVAAAPSLHAEPLESTDASAALTLEAHATPRYVPPNQTTIPPREFLSILLI